jgi:hypothetical protein
VNEELKLGANCSIPTDPLKKMKVRVGFSLSFEQFESLKQHAEKTGGAVIRELVETITPEFDKIKKAINILRE